MSLLTEATGAITVTITDPSTKPYGKLLTGVNSDATIADAGDVIIGFCDSVPSEKLTNPPAKCVTHGVVQVKSGADSDTNDIVAGSYVGADAGGTVKTVATKALSCGVAFTGATAAGTVVTILLTI